MPVRVTMHFDLRRQSWSETFLYISSPTITEEVRDAAAKLLFMRFRLCAQPCVARACVLSVEDKPAQAISTGDSEILQTAGRGGWGGKTLPADRIEVGNDYEGEFALPPNNSLLVSYRGVYDRWRKLQYMAGLPTALANRAKDGVDVTAAAGKWWTQFKFYVALLVNAPGLGALPNVPWDEGPGGVWGEWFQNFQTPDEPVDVLGIIQQSAAPGLWGVTIASLAGQKIINPGDRVKMLRWRNRQGTLQPWAGQWYVNSTVVRGGETDIFLTNSTRLDPSSILKFGKFGRVNFTAGPLKRATNEGWVSRKRGVGYDPHRGRLRNRPH